MNKELVAGLLAKIVDAANVKVDEPMRCHTSFRIGGPADILVIPQDIAQVKAVLEVCRVEKVPFFVIGKGTNLLVRDHGIRGVVVKISENLRRCTVEGNVIEAEAGLLLSDIAQVALENELSGLEFASGIPGTLGGAVCMNAGAYGGEMKDVVESTQYLDQELTCRTIHGSEHRFGYRQSIIQAQGGIVLKSRILLRKGKYSEIKALMDELDYKRKDKQPLELPSAGSIFRRPEGYYTGKLVEDCGLRGFRLGGAQVSEKHCGFIVNTGDASAADVINLIRHVQKTVKDAFGVELQTEVKVIGAE